MQIKKLAKSDVPEEVLIVKAGISAVVYEYCNLHGLWMTEVK